MAVQKFAIRQQLFEIDSFSKEHVHELQNRISRLVNFSLIQKMENYFDSVIPANLLFRIDRLVLDLGGVGWETMENEIQEKLMEALDNEFTQRLAYVKSENYQSLSGISIETIAESKAGILEHFLLYGILPWYAGTETNFNADQLLVGLCNDNPSALISIIQRTGGNENVRRRISFQFSEESIQRLINIIEPVEAAFIFQTHRAIASILNDKQVIKTTPDDVSKAVWLLFMHYLLAEMNGAFERMRFVSSVITKIATSYQLRYHDLVAMFFKAAENTGKGEIVQPFKTVVYELFSARMESLSLPELEAENFQTTEIDIVKLSGRMELLQYYLHFGALPVAAETMTRADLAGLLMAMAKIAPVTIAEMLFSLQTKKAGLSYLFRIIGPGEYKALVNLVLPGKKSKLENIAELFVFFNDAVPFGNLNQEDVKANTWKFLLDSFLVNGTAVYDESRIIASLLTRFASITGTATGNMMASLHELLQANAVPGNEISRLHILFKDTVAGINNASATVAADDSVHYDTEKLGGDKNRVTAGNKKEQLTNILHFMLQYGAVPWWGYEFSTFSIEEIMVRLYESDAGAMLLLLRKAWLQPSAKARLLLHIPADTFNGLMKRFPGIGEEISLSIAGFFRLLDESKLTRYHATEFVRKSVYTVVWDILSQSGFSLFSDIIFYIETTTRLSGILFIRPEDFIQTLMQSLAKITSQAFGKRHKMLLQAALNHFEKLNGKIDTKDKHELPVMNEIADAGLMALKKAEHGTLIGEYDLIQQYFDFTGPPQKTAAGELAVCLQYFLQWNRLPGTVGMLEREAQRKLLRQVVAVVFENDRNVLQSIMEDEKNSTIARAYIVELFTAAGETEKEITSFLLQFNLLIINAPVLPVANEKFVPAPEAGNSSFYLLDMFNGDADMPAEKQDRMMMEGSKRVLNYFLTFKQIPGDIAVNGTEAMERLLKEAMFFLFIHEREYISAQFQGPAVLMAAKLYLYDLLAVSNGGFTDQLRKFIEEIRENDLSNLFLQAGHGQDAVSKEDWSSRIINSMQAAETDKERQEKHFFLSSPAFAKMVLEKFGADLFVKMAEQKIHWPSASGSVVRDWLHIIETGIAPGFYREKALELYYQFNIIFISGRVNIAGNDGYTITFVNYLSGQLEGSAKVIFKHLFDHASNPANISPQGGRDQNKLIQQVLRTEIMKLDEQEQVDSAIMKAEETKMSQAFGEDINVYRKQQSEALYKEVGEKIKPIKDVQQEGQSRITIDPGESIYIANAGLVLFHSYLETYFSRTGLMENREFLSEASRNRAVLLLQYLANEKTAHAEHELVLNKILCNVPLEEAIPVSFEVTEHEMEVTKELMDVFIERWDKIKNTSVEGVRNSFILRDGMLRFTDDYWSLKVEQRGYDILLQTFPWAYGYIKKSWMTNNLIVEWI